MQREGNVTRRREELEEPILIAINGILEEDPSIINARIIEELKARFGAGHLPSRETLYRRLREIRGKHDPVLEAKFDWDRDLFEGANIPWEASSFLLDMWAQDDIWRAKRIRDISNEGSPTPFKSVFISPVTMRLARFWWDVHQVIPQELPEYSAEDGTGMIPRWLFIHTEANYLWRAELSAIFLNKPVDTSGNWARFAYRPWEEGRLVAYVEAIHMGRINRPVTGIGTLYDKDFTITEIVAHNRLGKRVEAMLEVL
jgi:hypothetical protein